MRTLYEAAKQFCANFDVGGCVYGHPCLLASKKPCAYFRKSVWPNFDPGYRYAKHTKHYPGLRLAFGVIYGQVQRQDVRRCPDCNEPLKKRQRVCEKCRRKHRRKTKRHAMRKYRD